MKITLDLPDQLIRKVEALLAKKGQEMEDFILESLERSLDQHSEGPHRSLRDIVPISVGEIHDADLKADRLEEMLAVRGHRY